MSEGRHAVSKDAESRLKSARWVLVLAALILVPLALFGLAIYWLTSATTLALYGALTVVWVALFIKSIVQRRADRWFPWIAAGALVGSAFQFATALGQRRHWSASSLHSLALIGDVVDGVVAVILGVVAVIWIRTVAWPWLRRRFAHS
jgi:hypothetical protein